MSPLITKLHHLKCEHHARSGTYLLSSRRPPAAAASAAGGGLHPPTHGRVSPPQVLQADLRSRQSEQRSLQVLWSQLQPRHGPTAEGTEAQEKLHVTASKLRSLLRHVERDLSRLDQRMVRASGHMQAPF